MSLVFSARRSNAQPRGSSVWRCAYSGWPSRQRREGEAWQLVSERVQRGLGGASPLSGVSVGRRRDLGWEGVQRRVLDGHAPLRTRVKV